MRERDGNVVSNQAGWYSRRELLRRSPAVGAGLGLVLPSALTGHRRAAAATERRDYTDRATFDWADQRFRTTGALGQADDLNENGGWLAWSQAFVLMGYTRMYEATGDTGYLDRLVGNVDQVLASRDSERGVTDFRGLSLPAWRAGGPFTVGSAALRDAAGDPVLEVRTALTYAETAGVRVLAGSRPGTFRLDVSNTLFGWTDTFDNLVMDPASADYVVTRLFDAFPTNLAVTAKDLRPSPGPGAGPAPGSYGLPSQFLIFAVHTGLITYPIARFVRLVRENPRLRRSRVYGPKVEEYLAAVEAAIAVHDWEWRENGSGEGYYIWVKGSPNRYDGVELPANQFLAPGRTLLQLAAITGRADYADRAAKLARTFARDLRFEPNGSRVWPYWPTWGRIYQGWDKTDDVSEFRPSFCCGRQVEDMSHGHIDVDFAYRAFRDGVAFNGRDMVAFSRTYTRNVAATTASGEPTVHDNVDGSGATEHLGMEYIAPAWVPLAFWDGAVFAQTRDIYNYRQPDPATISAPGYILFCTANLHWFATSGA